VAGLGPAERGLDDAAGATTHGESSIERAIGVPFETAQSIRPVKGQLRQPPSGRRRRGLPRLIERLVRTIVVERERRERIPHAGQSGVDRHGAAEQRARALAREAGRLARIVAGHCRREGRADRQPGRRRQDACRGLSARHIPELVRHIAFGVGVRQRAARSCRRDRRRHGTRTRDSRDDQEGKLGATAMGGEPHLQPVPPRSPVDPARRHPGPVKMFLTVPARRSAVGDEPRLSSELEHHIEGPGGLHVDVREDALGTRPTFERRDSRAAARGAHGPQGRAWWSCGVQVQVRQAADRSGEGERPDATVAQRCCGHGRGVAPARGDPVVQHGERVARGPREALGRDAKDPILQGSSRLLGPGVLVEQRREATGGDHGHVGRGAS
jgi:hypothetical protein